MFKKIINNKRFVYPLLAMVVLIWSRAIWQVNQTVSAHNSLSNSIIQLKVESKENYQLLNLENDPFSSSHLSTPLILDSRKSSRSSNETPKPGNKKHIAPPRAIYNGYILKAGIKYGLFEIGNRHRVIKKGDLYEESEWVLQEIERDSCVFILNKTKKNYVIFR